MRNFAMIPARLGSKRVPNKNLRMIDGKPLICYILDTVISSGKFKKDEIFINSESEIFESVARSRGVKFYKRDPALATDSATNDDFTFDFINQTGCDIVYQFLPTSPFLTVSDISRFVEKMGSGKIDTLVSVKSEKIECVFDGKPINFDKMAQTPPSQYLTPVNAYACGMMAWRSDSFKRNMGKFNSAYHGADGRIDFFEVSGFSTVDIDNPEDFDLAETIQSHLSLGFRSEPTYYNPDIHEFVTSEVDVPEIIKKDGVSSNEFTLENKTVVNVSNIIQNSKQGSWIRRIVNTENNSCCLISQNPGEGNRRHYHPSWNEWWYIVEGEWEFKIESDVHIVKKDDIVFIPKNSWHQITAIGNSPATRLAVSREDVKHVYQKKQKN
jgi:CMP-N-acetylneuraminic acid synthetase/quercetin dioxygenase-like cupin family protein